uniref:Uncharacterized protein n=1 Tax=Sarcophilus harrisii TaxID=9305 RepID=A0A7N4NJS8_SARHA
DWIKSQNPIICCLQETHLKQGDAYRVKVKGWSKIYYASGEFKKAGVAILISDQAKVKIDLIKRDKEGNYILLKVHKQRSNINIKHICTKWYGTQLPKGEVKRVARRNRQQNCNSRRSQPCTLRIRQIKPQNK